MSSLHAQMFVCVVRRYKYIDSMDSFPLNRFH